MVSSGWSPSHVLSRKIEDRVLPFTAKRPRIPHICEFLFSNLNRDIGDTLNVNFEYSQYPNIDRSLDQHYSLSLIIKMPRLVFDNGVL